MTKRIADTATAIGLGLLFALCLFFVSIRLAGLTTFIVSGGSMAPSVPQGALVLVQPVTPADVRTGDVITYQHYDQTTTHRVIAITETAKGLIFETKGDANSVADPEAKTFGGKVGIVRVSIPLFGYAIAAVQASWRLVLTLMAAAIFFGCAGGLVFAKEIAMPMRLERRLVRVTVDADEEWRSHLAWIAR